MTFLAWLENSAFSTWIRTTPSIFGYAGVLFLHTAGFALSVGVSMMIDLRLLGFAPRMPVAPLEGFFDVLWAGIWLNVCSGLVLFAQDATARAVNPLFGLKLLLIGLAVCTMVFLRRTVWRVAMGTPITASARLLAALSLALWLAVTIAGRLMSYVPGAAG